MTLPTIRFGDIGPNDGHAERLRVVRIDPILIRSLVGSLTVELRQLLPCGRSNPRFLRQPPEKLLIVLARLPAHNRAQGRVRLQGRGIDAHRLPPQQALFRQQLQHPAEHRLIGFHVDQASGARASAASLSVRSKSPFVVAASLFGPLPCAQSTAHCCESLNYLRRESRLAPRAARVSQYIPSRCVCCMSSTCRSSVFSWLDASSSSR